MSTTLHESTRVVAGTRTRKGVPNKKGLDFRARLAAYCTRKQVDPHYWMARMLADTTTHVIGTMDDGTDIVAPTVPLSIKLACAEQLAQYLQPKLRSIVVAGDPDNPLTLLKTMSDADLDALITRRLRDAGYDGEQNALPEGSG